MLGQFKYLIESMLRPRLPCLDLPRDDYQVDADVLLAKVPTNLYGRGSIM